MQSCSVCAASFPCKILKKIHSREAHKKKKHQRDSYLSFECRFFNCLNFFETKQQLELHFDQEHAPAAKKFGYIIYSANFVFGDLFKLCSSRRFICDFCKLWTNDLTIISSHIVSQHLPSPKVAGCPKKLLKRNCIDCGRSHSMKNKKCPRCSQVGELHKKFIII